MVSLVLRDGVWDRPVTVSQDNIKWTRDEEESSQPRGRGACRVRSLTEMTTSSKCFPRASLEVTLWNLLHLTVILIVSAARATSQNAFHRFRTQHSPLINWTLQIQQHRLEILETTTVLTHLTKSPIELDFDYIAQYASLSLRASWVNWSSLISQWHLHRYSGCSCCFP